MILKSPLKRSFYNRTADVVARELLGKIIVRKWRHKTYLTRIIETEAYCGVEDKACHAHKGITPRTSVMFGPPGYSYVYFVYGMHSMLNFVTAEIGNPHAVLIRSVEPVGPTPLERDRLKGPGRLTASLRISRSQNSLDLCTRKHGLWVIDGPPPKSIIQTTRIGIQYAKEWALAPFRFYESHHNNVSIVDRSQHLP